MRVYPTACTSAYCGRTTCPADCPSLPALHEFKAWVVRTGARVMDPVWCPLVYTAPRHEAEARQAAVL